MKTISETKFNPYVLHSLRTQLSFDVAQIAKFTSIPADVYSAFEDGSTEPSSKDLKKLSKFFRIKELNFFRSTPPKASKALDFRGNLSTYRGEPGPILDAIETATQMHKLLSSGIGVNQIWGDRQNSRLERNDDVEQSAEMWRERLGINNKAQIDIPSHNLFFTYVRSRIEKLGISVIVSSFEEKFLKGLVLGANSSVPVILINSYMQQKSSRTFTLAHEFGHVLLGTDSISNPYQPDGADERFCNKFAAAMLMPQGLIAQLLNRRKGTTESNASIKWLSNKLKVSMEAVVIRLQECGLVRPNYWNIWKAQFDGLNRLPSEEKEGGGGNGKPVDQGLTKLARYGFLFGLSISSLVSDKKIASMTIYRASRLKPKYFDDLARAARDRLAEVEVYAGE